MENKETVQITITSKQFNLASFLLFAAAGGYIASPYISGVAHGNGSYSETFNKLDNEIERLKSDIQQLRQEVNLVKHEVDDTKLAIAVHHSGD